VSESRSVEFRLIQLLAGISAVAIVGVLSILPYRLYERDIRHATVEAHRLAGLLHVALADSLARGEDTSALVNRFQGNPALTIRLRPLAPDEQHPAAENGRGSSTRDDTDLRYVAPPILDNQGRTWLAEMQFDLSPMKRESIRLIIDLVIAVALGSIAFSAVVYWLVHTALVVPLRRTTKKLRSQADCQDLELPHFESREMEDLSQAIQSACRGTTESAPG
jgi:hypothetical protein